VLFAKGYGMASLEHRIPMSPQSVLGLASVSKQFTALAIILLDQRGELSLDDHVRDYIPELPDYAAPVTIRHLIHHTSGLRDNSSLLTLTRGNFESEGDEVMLSTLGWQKGLNFPPGQHRGRARRASSSPLGNGGSGARTLDPRCLFLHREHRASAAVRAGSERARRPSDCIERATPEHRVRAARLDPHDPRRSTERCSGHPTGQGHPQRSTAMDQVSGVGNPSALATPRCRRSNVRNGRSPGRCTRKSAVARCHASAPRV
jgi:hypothetical protein